MDASPYGIAAFSFFMAIFKGDNLDHVNKSLPPEVKTQINLQIGAIIQNINSFTGEIFGCEGNPNLRAKQSSPPLG